MRKTTKSPGEKIVKDIKRATRKHYSSEEEIRFKTLHKRSECPLCTTDLNTDLRIIAAGEDLLEVPLVL